MYIMVGGFMTFVPDILEGSPNLDTADPILLWVRTHGGGGGDGSRSSSSSSAGGGGVYNSSGRRLWKV